MSQFYPPDKPSPAHPIIGGGEKLQRLQIANCQSLNRTVSRLEYETVIDKFHSLGFTRGWLQEFDSHQNYRPDFSKDQPFE
jgi:putative pyruvate formate lyase activating enzyme